MKFVIKKSASRTQPYYFVIKSSNGQVLATSETYVVKASAQSAIDSIKLNAASAKVEDET